MRGYPADGDADRGRGKAGSAPSIGKGTYNAIDAIRPDCAYVVAPVEEPYPLNEKLSVVRLEDLDGIYKKI